MTDDVLLIRRLRDPCEPGDICLHAEAVDRIERQARDIAALMADNAEQVRISSEAVRSAINSRNLCRAQSYALLGVIDRVERGDGFDVMCLETVKRVYGVLAGRDDG